jgi:molybdopterin/thiamine biosynthesis adenylyltransferase
VNEQLIRQGFLGAGSDEKLARLRVGVIGLGGGGSHVVQQLAHLGVGQFTVVDHDRIDISNLNRLIGGTHSDAGKQTRKTVIAKRQIRRINPQAKIRTFDKQWQLAGNLLRDCDILVGCVDSFSGRAELEEAARRYLIPYIDIGMDVFPVGERFAIAGQVALSMPGHPCLRCMGIIRDEWLAKEAQAYGAAAGRPQVVWPNGVLASLAVGVIVQLVTPWHDDHRASILLEYDGNSGEVIHSRLLDQLGTCAHFDSLNLLGDPWYLLN